MAYTNTCFTQNEEYNTQFNTYILEYVDIFDFTIRRFKPSRISFIRIVNCIILYLSVNHQSIIIIE